VSGHVACCATRRSIAVLATFAALACPACTGGPALLTDLVGARDLAATLRIEFTKATEAVNRAVMADTDDASKDAAREAKQSGDTVLQTIQKLRPLLQQLNYPDEVRLLGEFEHRFGEYRQLEDTILGLAVENTNLKAQRMSFGPIQESANAFRDALGKLGGPHASRDVGLFAAQAMLAVREVQVIEARHIAEADEAAMTRMEAEMSALEDTAQRSLTSLKPLVGSAGSQGISAAASALERFRSLNAELIALSRRNSNVRSLALALGRMRMLAAECDDTLLTLQDSLDGHSFKATR